jgi:hypothetical protein
MDARIVARQALADDAQPVRCQVREQVQHDLHRFAGVHAGEVREDLEPEDRVVMQCPHHLGVVRGRDADLGGVVARRHGALSRGPRRVSMRRWSAVSVARLLGGSLDAERDGRPDGSLVPVSASFADQLLQLHHPVDEALGTRRAART